MQVLVACWGVVMLSLVCVYAGLWGKGVEPTGVPRHGTIPQEMEPSDAFSHSPGGQAFAAPRAGTASAALPRQIELADPQLASTAIKRMQLTYLVRCALPADIELYTQHGTERFTFPGQMGLAPRWLSEAMTPSEERWVSACLLALVNYFGKQVRVSLRATRPPVPTLKASDEEQQTFSIFEGGFFGNLFTPHPAAYTCRGERTPEQAQDPILQDRVCTQEAGARTTDGRPLTYCHFIMTGRCEDDASLTVDGQRYAEVIFTYLKPRHRP
jgi:hypothetical protein